MSFIYEDKNLATLLSIGAQSAIKQAQQTPDWNMRGQVAFYLINDLKSQLAGSVDTELNGGLVGYNGPKPQATVADLDSLDTFAKWLSNNKITWNGNRIAWHTADQGRPDDALEVQVNDPANPDVKHQPEVFVAKDELLAYLKYLINSQAPNNKVLQIKLTSIINDVNSNLGLAKNEQLSNKLEVSTTAPAGDKSVSQSLLNSKPGDPAQPGSAQQSATSGTNVNPQAFQRAIDALPLKVEDINLDRIKTFFSIYGQINPSIQSTIVQIDTILQQLTSNKILNNPSQVIFGMRAGPHEVQSWLSKPYYYKSFVIALQDILKNVKVVINDFNSKYGDYVKKMGGTAEQLLEAQTFVSGSIFDHNWDVLRNWEENPPPATGQK